MIKDDRSIVLLLDNASCRPTVKLSNVKLVLLPPKFTGVLQPLDQRIIRTVKVRTRVMLLGLILEKMDDASNVTMLVEEIHVLNTMR